MSQLTGKKCLPCEGGVAPLDPESATSLLEQLHPDWGISDDNLKIEREFRFPDHYQTIAFVNAIAWISHQEDHHPELRVGYNRCLVSYTTHAIGGLSENDFICAAKIDELLPS
ncbi:MAG: 4a-hydroxytetrahydrobiopterin dehydratase [Gammaproteobacteria bacterium]